MTKRLIQRRSVALAVAFGAGLAATMVAVALPSAATDPALSITEVGNHFVNQDGQTVRLLGVDTPSSEYACTKNDAYAYGNEIADPAKVGGDANAIADDRGTADAIAAWDADAVRVPLNEDCWLGLNGEPSYGTVSGYQQAITDYVAALNEDGIYAILDLHWTSGSPVDETVQQPPAGETFDADGQRPAPDLNSIPFWSSVARTFVDNHAVVFDLFNEPYSPVDSGDGSDVLTWACLENGGCTLPSSRDGVKPTASTPSYVNVGYQQLVNAVRGVQVSENGTTVSPTQPLMVGGLSYSNDLSQWLASEPSDPLNEIAASFHNYYGENNDTTTTWDQSIAPVAAQNPVVTGEFDQGYDCQGGPTIPAALVNFDTTWMNWADTHGVSYTAWGWWQLTPDPGTAACSDPAWANEGLQPGDINALIGDDGQPETPDGIAVHTHLLALDGVTPPPALDVATTLPAGRVDTAYKTTLTATGGTTKLTWAAVGALPAGLKLTAAGVLSGTPTVVGNNTFTVSVHDTSTPVKATTASLTVYVAPMMINAPNGGALPDTTIDVTLPATAFKAVGGKAAVTFAVTSGALPTGLKLATSGALSGKATVVGSYAFTITATDKSKPANVASAQVTITVEPMHQRAQSAPAATVKKAYTFAPAVVGGKSAYKWAVTGGSLPPGLKIAASTGKITGAPTTAGTYQLQLTVTDASKPANSASDTYTVVVNG